MRDQQVTWRALRRELREAGHRRASAPTISRAEERAWLAQRFMTEIFPVLTPLAIDPAHPFPFIANLGLGLALQLAAARATASACEALLLIPGDDRAASSGCPARRSASCRSSR